MSANSWSMRSGWSLDLAEVATLPGQPQLVTVSAPPTTDEQLDERAADLDRLWRRCASEAATSIVEVDCRDEPAVLGYLARRQHDRIRVAVAPFGRVEDLRTWLLAASGPILVAVSPTFPPDGIGSILAGGRRGQVLVLSSSQTGQSRFADAVRRAIEGPNAPWVPDRLKIPEATDCLMWAAEVGGASPGADREQAEHLARLVGGRSAGIVPLGRWLLDPASPKVGHSPLRAATKRLDEILWRRFMTTIEHQNETDDLVGLCAVILMIGRAPLRRDPAPEISPERALVDLAMNCDGRGIPLALAELIVDPAGGSSTAVRRAADRFVKLGLATAGPRQDDPADQDASEVVSIAATHQAALQMLNAPMFEQSSRRVITALHAALDRVSDAVEDGGGDPLRRLTVARHSLAACDAAIAAGRPSLEAAQLMERALQTFGSIRWTHTGEVAEGPSADELTDWGLDLSERFLAEVRTTFGRLSHETAVAAKTVAWTRRNHGDHTGALEALAESETAASIVGGRAGRELDAHIRYLRGTVLVGDNQVELARETFEALEREVFPDGVSIEALTTSSCPLRMGERIQIGGYLGRIQMAMGDLQGARDRLEDLLFTIEDIDEIPYTERWKVMQNLGLALVLLGETAQAETLLREVELGRDTLLGPDHPDTLQTKTTLARVQLMAGDPLGAMAAAMEVVEARRRVMGPHAPATMSAQLLAIRAQLAAGIPVTAAARELAATRATLVGIDHPSTLLATRIVAESLLLEGRPDQALATLDDIDEVTRTANERLLRSHERDEEGDDSGPRSFEPDPFERIELQQLRLRADAEGSGTTSVRPWEKTADGLAELADDLESRVGTLHPAALQLRVGAAWALTGAERWDDARRSIERLLRDLPEGMRRHPIAIQAKELRVLVSIQTRDLRRARRQLADLREDVEGSELLRRAATGLESDLLNLELLIRHADAGTDDPELLIFAMDALATTLDARRALHDAADRPPSHGDRLRAEALVRRWHEQGSGSGANDAPASLNVLEEAASSLPSEVRRRIDTVTRTSLGPRRNRTTNIDSPSAIRLGVQLLIDDHDLSVRRLADAAELNPGWVSTLLKAYEDAEYLRRPTRGRAGAVAREVLFAHLAPIWSTEKTPGEPGGPPIGIALPLPEWEGALSGLPVQTWAISGDRAAALLGAPVSLTVSAPYVLHLGAARSDPTAERRPSRTPADQIALAQKRFGAAAPNAAGTLFRVPPIPVPTLDGVTLPETPGIQLAHPIVIALDLWSSGGRGREVLMDWTPVTDGRSWRCW